MKHLAEEQLVAFRLGYAGPDEAAAIEEHLGACEACRAALDAIDATLLAVAQAPVPERSEGYGAEVWARIQPHLERPASWWQRLLRPALAPRRLALAGGLAVLVLAAFVAARFWPQPETRTATSQPAGQATGTAVATQASGKGVAAPASGSTAATSHAATPSDAAQVRNGVLLVALGDHLDRSQITLAELVNSANTATVDISDEQERARDLVSENRLYRQTALETGHPTIAAGLDDLERVLVEVANAPSELPQAEFDRVRQRIETEGIIFKVRVLGERVREEQTRPTAEGRVKG